MVQINTDKVFIDKNGYFKRTEKSRCKPVKNADPQTCLIVRDRKWLIWFKPTKM